MGHEEQASGTATADFRPGFQQASSPLLIPEHDLIRRIGAGSYGEVWLARNVVGTFRAIKIVRRDQHESAESFEREFKGLQKFEPVSRTHDGLVDILTLGLLPENAGFYYVMELADSIERSNVQTPNPKEMSDLNSQAEPLWQVETFETSSLGIPFSLEPGPWSLSSYSPRTLRAHLKARGALPSDEVIALGIKLTETLAHLHAHGLVHRDVKPSNILFIGGVPKLADAGLVAAMDDARSLVGTAGYIAPEGPGSPQGDLYALGKVLYEGAFGKDRQEFPALPADVASRPDHAQLLDINVVLLQACASNIRERYPSADQMHANLEVLQSGGSVKSLKFQKKLKRRMIEAMAVCGILAALMAILYSAPWHAPGSGGIKKSAIPEANAEHTLGVDELHLNLNAVQAIKHLEKAIRLDPTFADAYAQLADACFSIPGEDSSRKGQQAARRSVELDPASGLARSALAATKVFALDFASAAREEKRAVELSPDSEQVLLVSALVSAALGRTNEALDHLNKAMEPRRHTPSKLRVIYAGFVYGWCRQYDRAIQLYDAAPWLKDAVDMPHYEQSRFYLGKGDYVQSILMQRRSVLEAGGTPEKVNAQFDALERAFAQGGSAGYWRHRLELELSKTSDYDWISRAMFYAHLGNPDLAIENLRLAREKIPARFAIEIYTNSSFDPLREDPRFKELTAELWRDK
jgi:serine/threonine protein kinase